MRKFAGWEGGQSEARPRSGVARSSVVATLLKPLNSHNSLRAVLKETKVDDGALEPGRAALRPPSQPANLLGLDNTRYRQRFTVKE